MLRTRLTLTSVAACSLLAVSAMAADAEDDKVFYALGTVIYENLEVLNLSDEEADQVMQGLADAMAGKADEIDKVAYGPKIRAMTEERVAQAGERAAAASQQYITKMAAEKGARQTPSGLVYREIKAGSGEQPTATSRVKAHYHGTLSDGSVFDSSVDRGQPLTIGLNQVIPCWTEGIAMMKVGGKAKLTCPPQLAYGERGQGGIPPNSALTFDVELIEIVQ